MRALAVLHFLYGMVVTALDDFLILDNGVVHGAYERPANTAAGAGVNETVLRAGVQRILAIHKFRMQHHVTLLGGGFDVRKPFPVHKVPGTGHACGGRCRGEVSFRIVVLALYTEDAVNPAVLMGREAHVIHVGGWLSPLRHGDGAGPETEVVYAVGALSNGEEGLAIVAFHTGNNNIFVFPLDCTGVEGGVDAYPFHKIWIGHLIQVIPPLQRSVGGCENRVLPAFEYAVPLYGSVLLFYELPVVFTEPGEPFVKSHGVLFVK